MNHETQRLLFAAAVMVVGCSGMTQPEDIAAAEEICAKRGGFTSVARYRHGGQLIINCKDGSHFDVLLPAKP